ncbi:MAG: hypothetical protein ACOY58_01070, partial [Candidatus Micrarchaeota archaeon]
MAEDFAYVSRLYEELRRELEGFHRRINEVENIRYLEDRLNLAGAEAQSGIEIRIGQTAELIECVKAALASVPPLISFRPLREKKGAQDASSRREDFWNAYIQGQLQTLNELADAQAGLG